MNREEKYRSMRFFTEVYHCTCATMAIMNTHNRNYVTACKRIGTHNINIYNNNKQ